MKKKVKRIYLDYAATTPVDPRVMKAMQPYFTKDFGNTMSLHSFGQKAKEALEESRQEIANLINADRKEIIFTASATESNNLALKGVAAANKEKGKHIIISTIEHTCIIESAKWLEKEGFEITRLAVDKYGLIGLESVRQAIKPETILISIIHASNEIGTIQPIEEIGKICRAKGVYFHTDASQSFGKIPLDVKKMNIDLLTASSHKIYGPKGAALLYIRQGIKIEPLIHGGGQEFGLRSSTINLPAIVGFTEAAKLCREEMTKETRRLTALRDELIKNVIQTIKGVHLNGHPQKRLANNINFWFEFIEGESLVYSLNELGVAVSTGSACSSAKLEPSHVLLAIGLKPHQAHGSLRISLGRWTTGKEIEYFLKVIPLAVEKLRGISPFKKN